MMHGNLNIKFVSHLTLNLKLAQSAVCINEGICTVQAWIQCRSLWRYTEMYCFHRVLAKEYFPSQCLISNIILFLIFQVLRDNGYKNFCTVVCCVSTQSRWKHLENTSTYHTHCHSNLKPNIVNLYANTIVCDQEKNPTPYQLWTPPAQWLTNHFIQLRWYLG